MRPVDSRWLPHLVQVEKQQQQEKLLTHYIIQLHNANKIMVSSSNYSSVG